MEIWAPPTWASIHSYPVTYTYEKKDDMKRFLVLITLLLCCIKCRGNAKKELIKLPIDNYLKDNETLFLWTWTLHDDVNRRLHKESVPYQKAKDWYFSRVGEFGSCIWRMIHSFAVTYTPDLKNEYKEFINLAIDLICCEEWRSLGFKVLKIIPINKYLEDNHSLFLWTWTFHDEVNRELSRKKKIKIESLPYKKAKDWYFSNLSSDYDASTSDCKSCSV